MAGMKVVIRLPPEQAAKAAKAWRIAAETSKQQYPNNEERYQYYIKEAERLEEQANGH